MDIQADIYFFGKLYFCDQVFGEPRSIVSASETANILTKEHVLLIKHKILYSRETHPTSNMFFRLNISQFIKPFPF